MTGKEIQLLSILLSIEGALEMNETRLHKELFMGYNKHTHPRLPGTGAVTVTFDFQLIRILDVVSKGATSKIKHLE